MFYTLFLFIFIFYLLYVIYLKIIDKISIIHYFVDDLWF